MSDWSSDVCSSDLVIVLDPCGLRIIFADPDGRPAAVEAQHDEVLGIGRMDAPFLVGREDVELDLGVAVEVGRASCRDRVCQYVSISVVAVSLKKKKTITELKTKRYYIKYKQ